MKKMVFVLLAAFVFINSNAQDSLKINRIDSIAKAINLGDYTTQYDSIQQDLPDRGISMITYLTAVTDRGLLKKYINNARTTTTQNGITKRTNTYNIFYFDFKSLIKVEELSILDDKRIRVSWYYEDDKPLYFPNTSAKSAERQLMLLKLGKQIMEQYERLR